MKSRFGSSAGTFINLLLVLLVLISACGCETEMPIGIEQRGDIEETIVTEQTPTEEPDEPTTIVEEVLTASIPDTTNVLDAEDTKHFQISIQDESVLTLPEPTEEELKALSLDEGDVLAIEPMEDAPDGLLRKVVEVVRSDGMIEVHTEQASLDEAIETGVVHETVTLREADLRESSFGHGVTLIKAGNAPSKDGFTLSIDQSFGDGDIKVSGTANILPIFDFDMVIDHGLKQLQLTNKTKITGTVKVTSDIATVVKDEKELKKLSFKPQAFTIRTPLKKFKIWVTPEVVVKVGVEGNLSAEITTQVKQEVTLECGLSCKGSSCGLFNNPIKGAFTYDPPSISATAQFTAHIGPHLNLTVFGKPGPFAAIDAFLKMDANPSRTPWWKLSAGVRGRVGVDFDIFSVIKFHWEETLFEKEWLIARSTDTPKPASTPIGLDGTLTREHDGAVMVYVPGGKFEMGTQHGPSDEQPVHEVTLDSFWIDKYEVTNAQFAAFLNERGNQTEGGVTWLDLDSDWSLIEQVSGQFRPKSGYENHPMIEVTWYGAAAYCEWVGARLPTEAEWEYAARGPQGNTYPWGTTFDGERLNFCDATCTLDWKDTDWDDGYEMTAPVGSFEEGASWCKALDMAGNVWEWVDDWYDGYPGTTFQSDAFGTQYKVLRGGTWIGVADEARSAYRSLLTPVHTDWHEGFRCVGGSTSISP